MFNNLRNKIAAMIAPASSRIINNGKFVVVPEGAKSLTNNDNKVAAKHLDQISRKHDNQPLVGNFHVSHLDELASDYLKNAISNLGAWSCLARAFSEYERVVSGRAQDETKLGSLFDEFHCWNSSMLEDKQMDEEAILIATDKMATTRPVKGSKETDAIIARVRKMSVEEVKADREAKAAKQTAARKELILGFTQAVWCFTSSDLNPSIASAKAAAKAVQTLEWVANSWNGDPAGIAAELLLIERDLGMIEKMARDAEAKGDDTFVDGTLTSDGLVRNAKLSRKFGEERSDSEGKLDKRNTALDVEAFRKWQQDQAA